MHVKSAEIFGIAMAHYYIFYFKPVTLEAVFKLF